MDFDTGKGSFVDGTKFSFDVDSGEMEIEVERDFLEGRWCSLEKEED